MLEFRYTLHENEPPCVARIIHNIITHEMYRPAYLDAQYILYIIHCTYFCLSMPRIRNIIISELLFSRARRLGQLMCLQFVGLRGGSDPSSVGRYADKNRIVCGSRRVIPVCCEPTAIYLYYTYRLYCYNTVRDTVFSTHDV